MGKCTGNRNIGWSRVRAVDIVGRKGHRRLRNNENESGAFEEASPAAIVAVSPEHVITESDLERELFDGER